MERETTKHAARLGEERVQESPSEDEAAIDPGARPDLALPGGLSPEEIDARSELARHLSRTVFPADRTQLLDAAVGDEAPDRVLALIRQLPEGITFATVQAAWDALGGHHEHR